MTTAASKYEAVFACREVMRTADREKKAEGGSEHGQDVGKENGRGAEGVF